MDFNELQGEDLTSFTTLGGLDDPNMMTWATTMEDLLKLPTGEVDQTTLANLSTTNTSGPSITSTSSNHGSPVDALMASSYSAVVPNGQSGPSPDSLFPSPVTSPDQSSSMIAPPPIIPPPNDLGTHNPPQQQQQQQHQQQQQQQQDFGNEQSGDGASAMLMAMDGLNVLPPDVPRAVPTPNQMAQRPLKSQAWRATRLAAFSGVSKRSAGAGSGSAASVLGGSSNSAFTSTPSPPTGVAVASSSSEAGNKPKNGRVRRKQVRNHLKAAPKSAAGELAVKNVKLIGAALNGELGEVDADTEQFLRRQRRMLKNREAANRSRARQKEALSSMQTALEASEARVRELEAMNKSLQAQLARVLASSSTPEMSNPDNARMVKRAKTAGGVTLFVIAFAFALFATTGVDSRPPILALPAASSSAMGLPAPRALPAASTSGTDMSTAVVVPKSRALAAIPEGQRSFQDSRTLVMASEVLSWSEIQEDPVVVGSVQSGPIDEEVTVRSDDEEDQPPSAWKPCSDSAPLVQDEVFSIIMPASALHNATCDPEAHLSGSEEHMNYGTEYVEVRARVVGMEPVSLG